MNKDHARSKRKTVEQPSDCRSGSILSSAVFAWGRERHAQVFAQPADDRPRQVGLRSGQPSRNRCLRNIGSLAEPIYRAVGLSGRFDDFSEFGVDFGHKIIIEKSVKKASRPLEHYRELVRMKVEQMGKRPPSQKAATERKGKGKTMKTNEINWTADQSIPAIAGRELADGRYMENHPQAGECVDFGTVRVGGKDRRLIVKLDSRPSLRAIVDAAIAAEAEADQLEAERMKNNVPGLAELQAAIDGEQQYHRDFNRMMDDENNDGVNPPKHPAASSAEVAKKYPRAAVYVRAENYSFASHWAKAKAGKEAMEIIASGGNIEDAEAKLENWLADNNVYVD